MSVLRCELYCILFVTESSIGLWLKIIESNFLARYILQWIKLLSTGQADNEHFQWWGTHNFSVTPECLTSLTVEKFLLLSSLKLLSVWKHCPLSCLCRPSQKVSLHGSYTLFTYSKATIMSPQKALFSRLEDPTFHKNQGINWDGTHLRRSDHPTAQSKNNSEVRSASSGPCLFEFGKGQGIETF